MQHSPKVLVFETAGELAQSAADRFVRYAAESQTESGRFTVSLAGGNTPRQIYELLAGEQVSNKIDWHGVYLFFGDERCVAPANPDSNYRMVEETLLTKVALPSKNVFRMSGEGDPDESARNYEAELRAFFGSHDWPRFDLVLLGMGADGHTASLFPGADSLEARSRWVLPTRNPQGQSRITLSVPALNHAAHIVFLVTGNEKAPALKEVLGGQSKSRLPASLVKPVNGTLEWLVDRAAASLL